MFKKTKKSDILLFSSGMDSFIAYFWLKRKFGIDPLCIFFDMGHRYVRKESMAAVKLNSMLSCDFRYDLTSCIGLGKFEKKDAEIPLRNFLMAMSAAEYFDYSVKRKERRIWVIVQQNETKIPDRKRNEFKALSGILSRYFGCKIKIDSPFWKMTKQDFVQWYIEKGFSKELLKKTIGCYSEEEGHCGKCPACLRRAIAFEWAGIFDIREFKRDIRKWKGIKEYIRKFKAGLYGKRREKQTLEIFRKWGYKMN